MSIKIDLTGLDRKLSAENMQRGKYAMANQVLADMDQYVPNKSSDLRSKGRVDASGDAIVYPLPYAKAQFYGTNGIAVFRNYTTPGTGKRWDLKAQANHGDDWADAFVKGAGL